jgi:hypothetical protein
MGIHRKFGRNTKKKSGCRSRSGTVGRQTVPDFSQKVKKLAMKKSGVAKSGIWNELFR